MSGVDMFVVTVAALVAMSVAGILLAWAGARSGDRVDDATVRIAAGPAREHPEGPPRSVRATISNPGAVPVLAGLSVRRTRVPGWFGSEMTARVPYRTRGRRYGASAQEVVGVVGPGERAVWTVPAPRSGRAGRLVAVIGQPGDRLRVITWRVTLAQPVARPAVLGRRLSEPGEKPRP